MRCHFVSGDSSAGAHWKNEKGIGGVEFELVMMGSPTHFRESVLLNSSFGSFTS